MGRAFRLDVSNPIVAAMVNGGGLGVLAAALFYLHTSALKVFREELASERKTCQESHDRLIDSIDKLAKEVRGMYARSKREVDQP